MTITTAAFAQSEHCVANPQPCAIVRYNGHENVARMQAKMNLDAAKGATEQSQKDLLQAQRRGNTADIADKQQRLQEDQSWLKVAQENAQMLEMADGP